MYDESQSFIARFSGFFLFLIALLVVGFLVFLTVRSAQDSNGDADLAVTTSESSEAVVEEDGSVKSDNDEASQVAEDTQASDDEGVVATPDDDVGLTTDNSMATDQDEVAAADTDDESEVAGATDQLANTGPGSDLPNTGPAETIGAIAVIGLMSALGYNFARSNREFTNSLLGK